MGRSKTDKSEKSPSIFSQLFSFGKNKGKNQKNISNSSSGNSKNSVNVTESAADASDSESASSSMKEFENLVKNMKELLDTAKQSSIVNISRSNPWISEKKFREDIFELEKLHGEMNNAIYLLRVTKEKSKCVNDEIRRFKEKLNKITHKSPYKLDAAITNSEKDLFVRWEETKSMSACEQKQDIIDELRDEVQARIEAVVLMQDILDREGNEMSPKSKKSCNEAVKGKSTAVKTNAQSLLLNTAGTSAFVPITPRPMAVPTLTPRPMPVYPPGTSPASRVTFLQNTTVAPMPTASNVLKLARSPSNATGQTLASCRNIKLVSFDIELTPFFE